MRAVDARAPGGLNSSGLPDSSGIERSSPHARRARRPLKAMKPPSRNASNGSRSSTRGSSRTSKVAMTRPKFVAADGTTLKCGPGCPTRPQRDEHVHCGHALPPTHAPPERQGQARAERVASEGRTGGKRGQNGWQARAERVASEGRTGGKRGQNGWQSEGRTGGATGGQLVAFDARNR